MTTKFPTRKKSASLQQGMRVETPILGKPRDTKYSKIAKKGCFGPFLGKMALTYNTLFGLIHLNVFSRMLITGKYTNCKGLKICEHKYLLELLHFGTVSAGRTLESTCRCPMQNPLFLPWFSKNVLGQKGQKHPIFQGPPGTEILKKPELRGQKFQKSLSLRDRNFKKTWGGRTGFHFWENFSIFD